MMDDGDNNEMMMATTIMIAKKRKQLCYSLVIIHEFQVIKIIQVSPILNFRKQPSIENNTW